MPIKIGKIIDATEAVEKIAGFIWDNADRDKALDLSLKVSDIFDHNSNANTHMVIAFQLANAVDGAAGKIPPSILMAAICRVAMLLYDAAQLEDDEP